MESSSVRFQRILRVTSDDIVSKPVSKKLKRSKKGCFSCKKRKVKCDENKPNCKNCNRSKLQCQWPEDIHHRYEKVVCFKSALTNKKESSIGEAWSSVQHNSFMRNSACGIQAIPTPNSDMFSPSSVFPADEYRLWLPDVELSRQDAYFYFSFVDRFLPTIAHPFIREKLSTARLLLRHTADFPILREVYLACGVSILAFDFPSYKEIAASRYSKALKSLYNVMKDASINLWEDWLFNAVQMLQILCLRNNFTGYGSFHGLQHFRAAYTIITKRLQIYIHDLHNSDNILPLVTFGKDVTFPRFVSSFSPLNRILVENFIFNYSAVIFFCEHKALGSIVPNPFEITALFEFYSTADSSMEDNWFNINVFGPTTYAFEIAAKCTWTCRRGLPLSVDNIEAHKELLANAEMNLRIVESAENNSPSIKINRNYKTHATRVDHNVEKNAIFRENVCFRLSTGG